jgi:predicted transcriptional regulator of viral defense system
VESGDLVRIKNGYYTDRIDRFSEEELIARLFPDARLCMDSALYAYGYLSEKPYGWHLAVDKNTSKSRFRMDYPKVIPYYTEADSLEIGSTTIELSGYTFQIYDRDRVICDCFKYEGKMEREVFKAAVQGYIRDEEKDISSLMEYARARKVVGKVQSMIGVWL